VREDGYVTRRYWEQTKLNKVMRTIEKECGLRELTNYQEMGFKGCDRQYKLYLMEKSQNNRHRSIKKFIIQTQLYEQLNKDDNQGIDIVEFLAKLEKDETIELTGLEKKSSPNITQTGLISLEYVNIVVKPVKKAIRNGSTKRF
jgi:hypothetical protein